MLLKFFFVDLLSQLLVSFYFSRHNSRRGEEKGAILSVSVRCKRLVDCICVREYVCAYGGGIFGLYVWFRKQHKSI